MNSKRGSKTKLLHRKTGGRNGVIRKNGPTIERKGGGHNPQELHFNSQKMKSLKKTRRGGE